MKQILKSSLKPVFTAAEALKWRPCYTKAHHNLDPEVHIREAAQWLTRAQDHGRDRGFSYGASLDGDFQASYPETTGYIIATCLALADFYHDADFTQRAVEAGDWEIAVQLPCGAVQAGKYSSEDPQPKPAVFNTGMVLLGWAPLYSRTREKRYLEAGRRAADWLISVQEADGNWVRGHSPLAAERISIYNVKSAWGLCEFGITAGDGAAVQAAVRNARFALTHQRPNGWFADCCLTDGNKPLLHTIAYAMQGLLGIGLLTVKEEFVAGAARCADSLLRLMRDDGFLPGRIDDSFRGAVCWCCLTGSAQTSIVWSQLYRHTGKRAYLDAARAVNRYIMSRHDISSRNPAVRGAVAGSWPVWGEYGKGMVLNWATKFFIDALLEQAKSESHP
jgi:hypothetical protein